MFQRHLVLMVKAPEAGRVKTRLANGIGIVGATLIGALLLLCGIYLRV